MEHGLELDYVDMPDGRRYYLGDEGHTCGRERDDLDGSCGCYSNDITMPQKVVEWYGFPDDDPEMVTVVTGASGNEFEDRLTAAFLNDDKGFDFAQIADAFDANFVHLVEPEDPSGRLEP
jgi:hypothetical protein